MYLPEAAVRQTLGDIAGLAQGSVVIFDVTGDHVNLPPELMSDRLRRYMEGMRKRGEPFLFGVASDQVANFCLSCSPRLQVKDVVGRRTLAHRVEDKAFNGMFNYPGGLDGAFVTAVVE